METILLGIFIFGLLQWFFAGVWFLIVAFREGPGHGIMMLFFGGIYSIIFSILHWEQAKKPLLTALIGVALIFGSALLKPVLAPGASFSQGPEITASQEPDSNFKQRLATAIATRIAAKFKRGSPPAPVVFPAQQPTLPMASAAPVPVRTADATPGSNAPNLKQSLMALVTKNSVQPAKLPTTNEWDQARALLRTGGVMQTGNQLFATVNQQVVTINDVVAVELNNRMYRFKVRKINLSQKTVQFDPVEP